MFILNGKAVISLKVPSVSECPQTSTPANATPKVRASSPVSSNNSGLISQFIRKVSGNLTVLTLEHHHTVVKSDRS
jgi:hypothetical protein